LKVFQCCLCGYRAHHRSNVVRHVKKIHTIDLNESNLSTNNSTLIENLPSEQIPNYSFNTTVQAPLILHNTNDHDQLNKSYADIHLSINIFLPKKLQQNSVSDLIDVLSFFLESFFSLFDRQVIVAIVKINHKNFIRMKI
jgi:hypothetical protein